ncbi:hypothetical protein [Streptomyces avermitilis]|uniref:hypothetical protein n=1 Tax=Streptomyces avermitilis TaxID=33903 RepID=UPI0036C5A3F6
MTPTITARQSPGRRQWPEDAGSHQAGKLGAAVLYVTHEPELTDLYAGLGFTLSPDGIGIPPRPGSSATARSRASASR